MMLATVVLPVPGGPHKIIEGTLPCAMAARKILPLPVKCCWPTNSSRDCGRSRSAKGARDEVIFGYLSVILQQVSFFRVLIQSRVICRTNIFRCKRSFFFWFCMLQDFACNPPIRRNRGV